VGGWGRWAHIGQARAVGATGQDQLAGLCMLSTALAAQRRQPSGPPTSTVSLKIHLQPDTGEGAEGHDDVRHPIRWGRACRACAPVWNRAPDLNVAQEFPGVSALPNGA
jgi:hypothetical protein